MAQPRGRSLPRSRNLAQARHSSPARNTRSPSRSLCKSPLKSTNSPNRSNTMTSPRKNTPPNDPSPSPRTTFGGSTPSKQRRGMVAVEGEEGNDEVSEMPSTLAVKEEDNEALIKKEPQALSIVLKKNQSPVTQELEEFEHKVQQDGGLIEADGNINASTAAGDSTNENKTKGKVEAGAKSQTPAGTMHHPRSHGKENVGIPAVTPFNYHHTPTSFNPMYSGPHSSSFDGNAYAAPPFELHERGTALSPVRGGGRPHPYHSQYHQRYYPPPHPYYPPHYGYGYPTMDDTNTSQNSDMESSSSSLSPKGKVKSTNKKASDDKKKHGTATPGLYPARTDDTTTPGPAPQAHAPYLPYQPHHLYRPPPYYGYRSASPYYPPYGGSFSTMIPAHTATDDSVINKTSVAPKQPSEGDEDVPMSSKYDVKTENTYIEPGNETKSAGEKTATTPPMPLLSGVSDGRASSGTLSPVPGAPLTPLRSNEGSDWKPDDKSSLSPSISPYHPQENVPRSYLPYQPGPPYSYFDYGPPPRGGYHHISYPPRYPSPMPPFPCHLGQPHPPPEGLNAYGMPPRPPPPQIEEPAQPDPDVRKHKNQLSRQRTRALKERLASIAEKPEWERTPEEVELLKKDEERRHHKNTMSKERAQKRLEMIKGISQKSTHEQTPEELAWLAEQTRKRQHKAEGDRLRRKRIKELGLDLKTHEGKPGISARGPLPAKYQELLETKVVIASADV